MVASSVASPLCAWLVAACMSIDYEKDYYLFQSSRRLSRWARSKKSFLLQSITTSTTGGVIGERGLISSICESSFQGLMSSCLAFEPCEDFNGYYGFSLFGSKTGTGFRKQRRMTKTAVHVEKVMAVAVEPSKEVASKKKNLTEKRRIVVTGMGAVTGVSHDPDVFYENLLEGVSGISEIEAFDCSLFPTRIAGEIKSFSTDGWVAPKFSRRMDKFMLYMLTADKKALAADAGISEEIMSKIDKTRCGVLIGSAMGGMKSFHFTYLHCFYHEQVIEALRISYRKMNPFCVPFATTNMGSAMLAMDLGWMGHNYSISTACPTSNFCILNAANHIIRGEANMMLCGCSDAAIIPIGIYFFLSNFNWLVRFCGMQSTFTKEWGFNQSFTPLGYFGICNRDYQNRDGFVMGEGAGVLLLEELEHAKRRGANIYAEFLSGSFTCNAYHMTEPHPDASKVKVSLVHRRSFIEVNEQGAKAAAVTASSGIEMCQAPPSKVDFVADHPFIFMVFPNQSFTRATLAKIS
ncbi:hypothetical protein GIB67_005502 [Kingdonia uniflora]|uniref:beta-ketoacyl-[acyl-carrier-protein] synthase I n=1 Tax=Kingdonia uniflora TaxID=39325 RepID=A0A7J7NI08_9MAGN|nr:hypothetical protein GIB67_005502 [Kingdonia uniflora]